jgi:hypothetical protein
VRRTVAGLLGGIAVFEFFRRRRAAQTEQPDAGSDPRADELRRKLAESRAIVDERDEFEAAELTIDETEHAPDDPERRRRDVHETAREISARMRDRS